MDIQGSVITGISLLLIAGCTTSVTPQASVSEVALQTQRDVNTACQNDPHSLALSDAMNLSYYSKISYELQELLHEMTISGRYQDYAEAIANLSMDVSKIRVPGQIEAGSTVTYSQNWITDGQGSRIVELTYSSTLEPSTSRLSWIISRTKEGHTVELSRDNSFIDGMSLSFLLGMEGYSDPKVSFCLAQTLIDSYHKHTIAKVTDADTLQSWSNSRTIGYGWGDNFANSTGPVCRYSIFNVADKLVSRVLVSCPEQ